MKPTLIELKILVDWASERMRYLNGSKLSEPAAYNAAVELHKRAKVAFDIVAQDAITKIDFNEIV